MEKENHTEDNVEVVGDGGLRPALSRDGQHLNSQPSNDPADLLNWPMMLRVPIYSTTRIELIANGIVWSSCSSLFCVSIRYA